MFVVNEIRQKQPPHLHMQGPGGHRAVGAAGTAVVLVLLGAAG